MLPLFLQTLVNFFYLLAVAVDLLGITINLLVMSAPLESIRRLLAVSHQSPAASFSMSLAESSLLIYYEFYPAFYFFAAHFALPFDCDSIMPGLAYSMKRWGEALSAHRRVVIRRLRCAPVRVSRYPQSSRARGSHWQRIFVPGSTTSTVETHHIGLMVTGE